MPIQLISYAKWMSFWKLNKLENELLADNERKMGGKKEKTEFVFLITHDDGSGKKFNAQNDDRADSGLSHCKNLFAYIVPSSLPFSLFVVFFCYKCLFVSGYVRHRTIDTRIFRVYTKVCPILISCCLLSFDFIIVMRAKMIVFCSSLSFNLILSLQ